MNKRYALYNGFTLVEMTVVLLLITLLASVAVRETAELGFQTRYEQTKERLDMIKQAILGNPRQIINGQQAVSGFVADMGRLPGSVRDLLQASACVTAGVATQGSLSACTTAGGTWTWFDTPCTDGTSTTSTACTAASGLWLVQQIDSTSGLKYGWHGPYLTVSGNPNSPDTFTDGWGRTSDNLLYGWRYEQGLNPVMLGDGNAANDQTDPDGFVRLAIQSLGKDQVANSLPAGDYIDDYPPNIMPNDAIPSVYYPNSLIEKNDWLLDISNGISVSFIKSTGKLPSISLCTDLTKTTKTTCVAASEIWDGGCENAGYFNKGSCPGLWSNCSDGVSTTKPVCELAGKNWYGEGFGCSDQSKPSKELCTSPLVWRSCSDDGTITSQSACLSANQIWYGGDIFDNPSATQKICMKIFYRKSDSTIGILVSDENKNTLTNDPKSITADGSFQTIKFTYFFDQGTPPGSHQTTDNPIPVIPIGTNTIGIYQYNGTDCATSSNTLYPADRQNPIQLDFHPHTTLPVINW